MIANRKQRTASLIGILITVFIDMMAFGMFIPDLQLRGQEIGAAMLGVPIAEASASAAVGWTIGFLISGFSVAQLLGAPLLGRLSDRVGRRKVLIWTCAIACAGHAVYAMADPRTLQATTGLTGQSAAQAAYAVAFFSRFLAGLAAANLGVAFAYVADVTTPENRAKGIGMVGAALGVGFILGPVTGATILRLGGDNVAWLGIAGGILTLFNLVYVVIFLPESLDPANVRPRSGFFRDLGSALRTPGLSLLLAMFFAFNFAQVMLQTTFFRLLEDPRGNYRFGVLEAKDKGSIILACIGLFGAMIQGGLLSRLAGRFGEVKLLRCGLLLVVPGLALVPHATAASGSWLGPITFLFGPILLVVALQGIGLGLSQPSLSTLVSRSAPPTIQGGIFGINQSLGAFARLIGPLAANPLFAKSPVLPYYVGAMVLAFPLLAAWTLRPPAVADSPQ